MSSRLLRRSSTEMAQQEVHIVEEKVVAVNGDVVTKKYNRTRFLGKGGFARVYELVSLDSNVTYAAKVIPKASLTKTRSRQKLMSEIKIHRSIHHQHVVSFEHYFEDKENVYILLEICSNQTLNELIRRRKRLTELEVQCYTFQTIDAIKYLHQHRIIHRDLKLGNMFLSEKMEIKLGDFGLATKLEFDGERKRTICGTPNYIAPEILEGRHGHSYEVDIWSLGVIIYTLLIGKPPFETSDVKTTYKKIKMNSYSFPEHVVVSQEAKALITRILNTDPMQRPGLDEILEHPFFHKNAIPRTLPSSTLAIQPAQAYIKQFQKGLLDSKRSNMSSQPEIVAVKPARSSSQPHFRGNRPGVQSVPTQERTGSAERGAQSNRKTAASSSYNPEGMKDGPEIWVRK